MVSGLHKYAEMPTNLPAQVNASPLQKEDLTPLVAGSLDFKEAGGAHYKAPYDSPGIKEVCAPVADLFVLRELHGAFA